MNKLHKNRHNMMLRNKNKQNIFEEDLVVPVLTAWCFSGELPRSGTPLFDKESATEAKTTLQVEYCISIYSIKMI